jgi:hypothetical protein
MSAVTAELHRPGDRPVLADLDRANGLERRPCPAVDRSWGPFCAIPGDESSLAEPAVGLEPWIASFSLLRPRIKGGEHGVEPTQGLLLGGERVPPLALRIAPADLPQLRGLHPVANADPAHAPRLTALLQCRVVQVAVIGEQPHCSCFLRACGVGAELKGAPHRARSFRHRRPSCMPIHRHAVSAPTAPAVAAQYGREYNAARRDRRCRTPARSRREAQPSNWLAIRETGPDG